jgi:SAM-dependent methyltransferase
VNSPERKSDRLVKEGYDRVAEEYAKRIYDELEGKPLDRHLLNRFAEGVRGRGVVCDLGCGPGHVARHLHGQGADVFGIDLSPRMVEAAARLNPSIDFRTGDMMALEAGDESWAGIVAFYSVIHIPSANVVTALREMGRVLQPEGLLLLAFHVGVDPVHLDDWWGHSVSLDFFFFEPKQMLGYLRRAGLQPIEMIEREPYDGVEHPSRRCYILATKQSQG